MCIRDSVKDEYKLLKLKTNGVLLGRDRLLKAWFVFSSKRTNDLQRPFKKGWQTESTSIRCKQRLLIPLLNTLLLKKASGWWLKLWKKE